MRMRIVVSVVFLACALALSPGSAGAAPSVQFGIQDDAWLEFGPGSLASRVAKLERMGFDAVRVTLSWHEIETSPGRYRWTRADRLLGAIHGRGLRPVVTVWGTPGWANRGQSPNVAPPDGLEYHFQNFTRTIAGRYPYVDAWLMWNEPNKPGWLKPASPRTYVQQILNPGYRGIKASSPNALVAGGVTAPTAGKGGISPVDFIRLMRANGALLDAYAHHPYPVFPGDTPFKGGCRECKTLTMASLNRLLAYAKRYFPRARVWLTEYGYQTNPPDRFGVSPELQARYIGEAARRVFLAPKVDLLIHYLYRDEPNLARWQSGLQNRRGTPKPGLRASSLPLAQVSRRGPRTVVWGQVRPGKGPQRYVLERKDGASWVPLGKVARTNARGYLQRSVVAGPGTKLRLRYPAGKISSPPLTIR
jgi:hypothetical protein